MINLAGNGPKLVAWYREKKLLHTLDRSLCISKKNKRKQEKKSAFKGVETTELNLATRTCP